MKDTSESLTPLTAEERPPGVKLVTQGRCPKHEVILEWPENLKLGRISKGELRCPVCKAILLRTCASSLPRVWRRPERVV